MLPVRLRRLNLHYGGERDPRSVHTDDDAAHRIGRNHIGPCARERLDVLQAFGAEAERAGAVALDRQYVRPALRG